MFDCAPNKIRRGLKVKAQGRGDATVYGFAWDSSQPATTLRQIDENGDNLTLTTSDFDNHRVWGGRRRCAITPATGEIRYGSNPRGDGLNYGAEMYVMVEQPQAHIAFWQDGSYKCWVLGDKPFVGQPVGTGAANAIYSEVHPLFYQRGHVGNPAQFYYTGAYEANVDPGTSPGIYSRQGAVASVNITPLEFESVRANALGVGWGVTNVWYQALKKVMLFTEFGNLNIQATLGRGYTGAAAAGPTVTTGSMDANMAYNGTFQGSTATQSVVWRGEDAIYGGNYDYIIGMTLGSTLFNISNPDGTGSANGRFNVDMVSGEYFNPLDALPLYSNSNLYIRDVYTTASTKYLFIPSNTTGASGTTFFSDTQYTGAASTGTMHLSDGGYWADGDAAGPARFMPYYPINTANAYTGSRLEYIPAAVV